MKPLSMVNFIKGSVRKILPLTITLCLAVALLYFLSLVKSQLEGQVREVNITTLENISLISGRGTPLTDEDIKKLDNENIREWYEVKLFGTSYNMALGGITSTLITMAEKDDILELLQHQKAKLVEGAMPQRPMEVILHRKMAANKGVTIGTIIEKDSEGWQIEEDIKVVGLIEGPGVFALGARYSNNLQDGFPLSICTVPFEGRLYEMNEYIERSFSSKYQIDNLSAAKGWFGKMQGPMNGIMFLIGIVLVFVLSVLLGNISMIQYTQRRKEFELLHAIGYTKKYIVLKMLKEIGISSTIGYVGGIVLAIIVALIMNICIWSDKGMDMPLIDFGHMSVVFIVPLIITLTSMIAPLKMLKFRDII